MTIPLTTIDERIAAVNAAMTRCDARQKVDGRTAWSVAIAALCVVKARLLTDSANELVAGLTEEGTP